MLGVLLPILFLEYEYDWAVFNMKAWCGMQSAKTNLNVENVFFTIARDIKNRVAESDSNHPVVCEDLNQLCWTNMQYRLQHLSVRLWMVWKLVFECLPCCKRTTQGVNYHMSCVDNGVDFCLLRISPPKVPERQKPEYWSDAKLFSRTMLIVDCGLITWWMTAATQY